MATFDARGYLVWTLLGIIFFRSYFQSSVRHFGCSWAWCSRRIWTVAMYRVPGVFGLYFIRCFLLSSIILRQVQFDHYTSRSANKLAKFKTSNYSGQRNLPAPLRVRSTVSRVRGVGASAMLKVQVSSLTAARHTQMITAISTCYNSSFLLPLLKLVFGHTM